MQTLSRLFSPIKIGSMELKNRIVMAPMYNRLANDDYTVTQKMIDYFVARAKGGVGLIILPSISVDETSQFANNLTIWSDQYIPDLRTLTQAIQAHGAKVIPQLCAPQVGKPPITSLTLDDIEQIKNQFIEASERAREAGCDGVEIHSAHAFLMLGSFISALKNQRTDSYGGSIQGRVKLLIEIVQGIRARMGSDFSIMVRISADELQPGGRDIRETLYIAPMLTDSGVDAFDLSMGVVFAMGGDWRTAGHAGTGTPHGANLVYARVLKEVVDVPVGALGRINDPRFAEDILRKNEADLIFMGRALLADPELPNKAADGRYEDIAPCVGCLLGCWISPPSTKPMSCVINPAVGREAEFTLTPAPSPKKVMVVGGGPGGLKAATVAALRGHDVTLYEKEPVLGGQINLASVAPMKQELTRVVQYLITQSEKAGVTVRLNSEVTQEIIREIKPDTLIIATGSKPLIPDIPGRDRENVVTAHDVLAGKVTIGHGDVFVAGGGMVGCEVAAHLANRGDFKADLRVGVTIIEMQEDIALDVVGSNRIYLLQLLREKGVKVITNTEIKQFLDDGVVIERDGREETLSGADKIVIAMGAQRFDELSKDVGDMVPELFVIGDAREPRKILEAVAEGAEVAKSI